MKDLFGIVAYLAVWMALGCVALAVALFPLLWFEAYMRENEAHELKRQEWIEEGSFRPKEPDSKIIKLVNSVLSNKLTEVVFAWVPYLTVQIVWVRIVWSVFNDHLMNSIIHRFFGFMG